MTEKSRDQPRQHAEISNAVILVLGGQGQKLKVTLGHEASLRALQDT